MRLSGFAIAPGRVLGKAFVFRRAERRVPLRNIGKAEAPRERDRLQAALRAAQAELEDLRTRLSHEAGEAHAYLFDAQVLMLQDPLFAGRSLSLIGERLIGAEWALSKANARFEQLFEALTDDYFRQVGRRRRPQARLPEPRAEAGQGEGAPAAARPRRPRAPPAN